MGEETKWEGFWEEETGDSVSPSTRNTVPALEGGRDSCASACTPGPHVTVALRQAVARQGRGVCDRGPQYLSLADADHSRPLLCGLRGCCA